MTANFEFTEDEWMYERDAYAAELENFQRDVYILINHSLLVATDALHAGGEAENLRMQPDLEHAEDEDYDQLADRLEKVWMHIEDQKTFLRNMALVALLSRLIHTLEKMAKHAPGRRYKRKPREGDFDKLWREYAGRFEIDLLGTEKHRIDFIDPLRHARNCIVHAGGEVEKISELKKNDAPKAGGTTRTLAFIFHHRIPDKYKAFVQDDGFGTRIAISQQQLDEAISSSIELVRWPAPRLRAWGIQWVKRQRTLTNSQSSVKG
jgi:hypothetical protein